MATWALGPDITSALTANKGDNLHQDPRAARAQTEWARNLNFV